MHPCDFPLQQVLLVSQQHHLYWPHTLMPQLISVLSVEVSEVRIPWNEPCSPEILEKFLCSWPKMYSIQWLTTTVLGNKSVVLLMLQSSSCKQAEAGLQVMPHLFLGFLSGPACPLISSQLFSGGTLKISHLYKSAHLRLYFKRIWFMIPFFPVSLSLVLQYFCMRPFSKITYLLLSLCLGFSF